MKILHTSDWHLGNTFHDRKRTEEFELFFTWLESCITDENIDALIVSGDIFDSGNPGTQALKLYFNFLGRIAKSRCRHVIITGGNHDSASLLNVPKEILRLQNIHVIGSKTPHPDDEVLILCNDAGKAEAIVCAVPYLRDRDVRTVEPGESIEDKTRRLLDGIQTHYHEVYKIAESKRTRLGSQVPLIVMGHLYTEGGQVTEDDGVREQILGTLVRVRADTFPTGIDYLALGHLHMPQRIGGDDYRRYSGSPLAMGFFDAQQQKKVIVIEFDTRNRSSVREIPIPCFQKMVQITGTCDEIESCIHTLKAKDQPIWIEIILDDSAVIPDIRQKIASLTKESKLLVMSIKSNRVANQLLKQASAGESLDELSETDIFTRCMDAHKIEPNERDELLMLLGEIIAEIRVDATRQGGVR